METEEETPGGQEKGDQVQEARIKTEEMEVHGMVEVKVEPNQVLTVTVDPSMVKSEPVEPNPTSSATVRLNTHLHGVHVDRRSIILITPDVL